MKRLTSISVCIVLSFFLSAQSELEYADAVLDTFKSPEISALRQPIRLIDSAIWLYDKHELECKSLEAKIEKAYWLDHATRYDEAVFLLNKFVTHFPSECDSNLLLLSYKGLSSTYLSVGNYRALDDLYTEYQRIFRGVTVETKHTDGVRLNFAIGMAHRGKFNAAAKTFRELIQGTSGDRGVIVESALTNLGTIYAIQGSLDSAQWYYDHAISVALDRDNQQSVMALLINLANLKREDGQFNRSIELLDSSLRMATEQNNIRRRADIEQNLAVVYAKRNQYRRAFYHLNRHVNLKDSILNAEKLRAVTEIEEQYQAEKRLREIKKLTAEGLESELEQSKAERTRNFSVLGGIVLFLAAMGLWYNVHSIRQSQHELEQEQKRSDRLLLNILPLDIANELKLEGISRARRHEQVSILFAKLKDFSLLTEQIGPEQLISEVDYCYKVFDEIIAKHSLEKIKTIGDSYMAAGGIPNSSEYDTPNITRAALAMQDFLVQRREDRNREGRFGFKMRVGIHTGPVVAGVVGSKKFSYDIWGDTVNTASRMESSGAAGRVNISQATYRLIEGHPEFELEYRGKVSAKHKGEVEMYFVKGNPAMR